MTWYVCSGKKNVSVEGLWTMAATGRQLFVARSLEAQPWSPRPRHPLLSSCLRQVVCYAVGSDDDCLEYGL